MKNAIYRSFHNQAKRICSNQIIPATDHRCWVPDGSVTLQMKDSGFSSRPPISIPTMFSNTVDRVPGHIALHTRDQNGQDMKWTYEQYMKDVRTAAKGFIALGLERYHTVGILGYNAPEWFISHVAAIHAGGFGMGIYQTNNEHACHYVCDHSRANILVVENQLQLEKILSIRHKLPHLRQIIQYSGDVSETNDGLMSWSQLMDLGRSETDQVLDERLSNIAVNQCACLCYTSGTTGNPKGAMISHDSVTFGCAGNFLINEAKFGEERQVSYLPLSHIAGMLDIYMPMGNGSTTCFADSNALKGTLIENLKYYKPTRFFSVPRMWEKMEEKLKLAGKETKGVKRKIADWAKHEALQYHLAFDEGFDKPSWRYKLAKKLVLSKIQESLGLDSVYKNTCGTGSATTSKELYMFFLSLG